MNVIILLYLLVFFFVLTGLLLMMKISIGDLFDNTYRRLSSRSSLRKECSDARGKKKNFVAAELSRIKRSLIISGNERLYKKACSVSFWLAVAGLFVPVVFNNIFLAPVCSLMFAAVPFLYLAKYVDDYNRRMKEELETTLSVITNSYVRSDDFVRSVRENLPYIKRPLKDVFKSFLNDVTVITPDIDQAMQRLKMSVESNLFHEWCDAVRACLDDRTLKDTLQGIVSKFTDTRVINHELKTIVSEPRKEFISMIFIVLGNIPLLRLLNKSWFDALINTVQGKITLAVTGVIIVVTTMYMLKFTKPVEYGSSEERL